MAEHESLPKAKNHLANITIIATNKISKKIDQNKVAGTFLMLSALGQVLYMAFYTLREMHFPLVLLFSFLITVGAFVLLPTGQQKTSFWAEQNPKALTAAFVTASIFLALLISEGLNSKCAQLTGVGRLSAQYVKSFTIAALILLALGALCYALTGRVGLSMALATTVLLLLSLVNYYMLVFRNRTFMPHDIYAAQTAVNVIGEYRLTLAPVVVVALQITGVIWAMGLTIDGYIGAKNTQGAKKTWVLRMLSLAYAVTMTLLCLSSGFWRGLNLESQFWNPNESSATHTFLVNFVAIIPHMRLTPPEGYEDKKAYLEKAYPSQRKNEADEALLPDKLILIMNEAFTDFSFVEGFKTNQDPLAFWHKLTQREGVISGKLVMDAFGGATALSEFQALTGSAGVAGQGINEGAMQRLVHSRVASLGDSVKTLGYQTYAMHPYTRSGYGREFAYPHMGFNSFISLETMPFEKKDHIRSYISDEAFYRYMAGEIEKSKDPVFVFGVTMQNHGGYTWSADKNRGQTPVEENIQIIAPKGDFPEARQYLNLLHQSDKALEKLIDYYENQGEKVMVVMFGDHWPALNDGFQEALEKNIPKIEQPMVSHTVPYIIWANYPIKTPTGPTQQVSVNYLSLLIKDTLGLPLTGFDQYLHALWQKYPVISAQGLVDRNGRTYDISHMKEDELLSYYEVFQYNNLTGAKGYMENLYIQE